MAWRPDAAPGLFTGSLQAGQVVYTLLGPPKQKEECVAVETVAYLALYRKCGLSLIQRNSGPPSSRSADFGACL